MKNTKQCIVLIGIISLKEQNFKVNLSDMRSNQQCVQYGIHVYKFNKSQNFGVSVLTILKHLFFSINIDIWNMLYATDI